jgi:cysteine-rich repeat protein
MLCLALAAASPAFPAAGRAPCEEGRFLLPPGKTLVAGPTLPLAAFDAIDLRSREVAVDSGCERSRAVVRATRRGVVVRARWKRCKALHGVRLRGTILGGSSCARMTGTLRARNARPVRFDASRSRCGDGTTDALANETCDAGRGCGSDSFCADDCSCRPRMRPDPPDAPSSTTTLPTLPPPSTCGNGVREANETCDGPDLGAEECGAGSQESGGGTLACTDDCLSFDRRGCFRCGNGVKDGSQEACDGLDFGGDTCATHGYGGDASHTLLCSTDCAQVLTSDCFVCGNGRLDPGEECDAGPDNGTGYCDAQCRSTCGNGLVQAPEECDDGNRVSGDGCSASCLPELNTGGGCIVATTGCTTTDSAVSPLLDRCFASWSFGGFASVPVTNGRLTPTCRKGDLCDLTPTGPDCTFGYQLCLNRTQSGGGTCVPPATGLATLASSESALLAAAETQFGGTIAGTTLTFAPAFTTPNLCVGVQVVVAPGTTRTVDVDVQSAGTALLDHDEVDFTCTPRFTCDPATENCEP